MRSVFTGITLALLLVACGSEAANPTATVAVAEVDSTVPPSPTTQADASPTTTTPPTPTTGRTSEIMQITGIVIAVDGSLQGTNSFTLLLEDGSELTLIPEPDLLFDAGPLSHLTDHIASGSPVRVKYTIEASGDAVAREVADV